MTTKRPPLIRLAAALAALSLFTAVGCAGGDEQPTAPVSPTLSEEEQQAEEYGDAAVASLEALLAEVDRLRAEGPGAGVTPVVEQHATSPYVQQLDHSLGWLSVENIRESAPSTRLRTEPVGEATATRVDVAVCVDTSTRKTVKVENGEPYDDGSEPMKELMVYEMHHLDGEWKAKDSDHTVLGEWNQAPCDGTWDA